MAFFCGAGHTVWGLAHATTVLHLQLGDVIPTENLIAIGRLLQEQSVWSPG